MAGTDAIINKILTDARSKADQILTDAKIDAEAVLYDTTAECDKVLQENLAKKQDIVDETIRRKKTVAELDVKKIVLKAKKDAIDDAFQVAKAELVGMDKKKYVALVLNMISEYAEDGDEVIIAEKDAKVLTKAQIDKIAKAKNISLNLSKEYGNFTCGAILKSKGMDKNLTFDVELKVLREEMETEIANMIFNKEN